jgi:hypothetical protein
MVTEVPAGEGTIPSRLVRLRRTLALAGTFSALVLLPCFWQRRIQAGDFSSHLYNAWLVQEAKAGRVAGLELAAPWTNVLFDHLLEWSIKAVGVEAAQRISVSFLVLNFFWGAFSLVAAVSGRPAWWLAPLLWMLAYGWVFHIGFFNFYLSLGLCFWALALAWRTSRRRVAAAAVLGAVATLAQALPVAWAGALAGYASLARRLGTRGRVVLFGSAAVGLWVLSQLLEARSVEPPFQPGILMRANLDQLFVYGTKYYLLSLTATVLCAVLLCRYFAQEGLAALANHIPLAWCALTVLGAFWLPFGLWLPGYKQALLFVPERMSLAGTVLLCGLLAGLRTEWIEKAALWALAVPFFAFLYSDHRALNAVEDRIQAAVAGVPPGSRVISALCLAESRIDAIEHMIDRVCIGRCYSYGNYEPWTHAFRLRAAGDNAVVVADGAVMFAMRRGEHVVRPQEAPLYEVRACGNGDQVCVRMLNAGERTSQTCVRLP